MNQVTRIAGGFTPTELSLIRRTVAADTNADEFELFIHTARHLRLDPLRKQVYAFVFSKDKPDKRRMSIITAIDGFRAIADRTGCYRPDDDEPVYEIDPMMKSEVNPIGLVKAVVRVFKFSHGEWHKVTASAYWDEYAPIKEEWASGEDGRRRPTGKSTLDTSGNWGKMPRLMLAKVAEALALRKAWPDDFAGVYAAEEMDRAKAVDGPAWEAADQAEEEKRLARIGGKNAVMFQFEATGTLEPVPVGQIADRIADFIEKNSEEVSVIGDFERRNQHALREFWAKAPSDALEVKKLFERARAQIEAA
ncbi:MAG: phage recombination protein Bet [Hyphomicrobiales bacterium]|jgi:phage recombination protein Bet|nr:phage recombination protein Bet [Hyphomicrobiales bacterium]